MNEMIKAERNKICSRKQTRMLFIAGVVLIVAYFFFFQFSYQNVFYDYDLEKMALASGFTAIEQRKEVAEIFEGKLSQNTLFTMQEKIDQAKQATVGQDENSAFSAVHVYRDQAAILEYLTNSDGSFKSLETAYPNSRSVTLGYCDGWDKLLSGMGSILSIMICLIVVITLSPVFSEEYALHTDSIIYSAQYGRTKLTTAKIIAALEVVIGTYLLYLLLNLVLYGCTYGLQGWNVSIACPGAEELCKLVDSHLVRWAREVGNDEVDTFIIPCDCPRFQSGDAKGLVKASTRGDDLYIFVDPGNYSVTYKLFGYENHLSPDDHFQNLMRIIQAVSGRAHRISVIMPSLYGGRQHRRVSRESLDCAFSLQQLRAVGVKNIITFDAHDPRVMNAVPTMSFDNVMPTYQVLKCLLHHVPDVSFHKDNFMIVSPDEGAMNRNMYYSSVLGCNLGMFYKRRDYSRVVNGRNPIVAHEYLGESVEGKDVFIADDIIASGESMLDIGYELKMRGARNIFTCCTFPLFTAGLEKFDKAYNDGIIKAVLGTNLTYRKPELLEREWYYDVDVSKYTAYFIAAINHDKSVSSIIDPMTKIRTLLDKHGIPMGGQQ